MNCITFQHFFHHGTDVCKDCETNWSYLPGLTVMIVFAMAVATITFLYSSNVVRTSAANMTVHDQYAPCRLTCTLSVSFRLTLLYKQTGLFLQLLALFQTRHKHVIILFWTLIMLSRLSQKNSTMHYVTCNLVKRINEWTRNVLQSLACSLPGTAVSTPSKQ